MHEGGVVEPGVDDDVRDVELLVVERLGRRAHVVLTQSDLEDVADGREEGKAAHGEREEKDGRRVC